MSHKHFCDYAGHEWVCQGLALRPQSGHKEPTVCICFDCGVPMEQADHNSCAVELLACPAHLQQQASGIGLPDSPGTAEEQDRFFQDRDGTPAIGFCLWCDKDFHTVGELTTHNADDMAQCQIYRKFRSEGSQG